MWHLVLSKKDGFRFALLLTQVSMGTGLPSAPLNRTIHNEARLDQTEFKTSLQ